VHSWEKGHIFSKMQKGKKFLQKNPSAENTIQENQIAKKKKERAKEHNKVWPFGSTTSAASEGRPGLRVTKRKYAWRGEKLPKEIGGRSHSRRRKGRNLENNRLHLEGGVKS